MLGPFWNGLGGKLAERWMALLLSPALLFWATGAIAWHWNRTRPSLHHDGWTAVARQLGEQVRTLPAIMQGLLVTASLIVVMLSALAAQRLTVPVVRALSGYWPRRLDWLQKPLLDRRSERIRRDTRRLRELAGVSDEALDWRQRRTYAELQRRYLLAPTDPSRHMATRLGNILSAFEDRPRARYGLHTEVCWPRLWLLLPDEAKKEVEDARQRLSGAAQAWLWGMLLVVWTPWAWWVLPLGAVVCGTSYFRALNAAVSYGEIFVACFDVHRGLLYQGLRWPLPASPAEERAGGEALSAYLENGSVAAEPRFSDPA
ncbi:hypothetical protein OG933_43615 [Streptomyces sp. NBC_00016]|uniref:hypothetical protein n=1 Tax=Streptomyces sp. NBC_00016 TaxID=2975622 RepID=UPI003252D92B